MDEVVAVTVMRVLFFVLHVCLLRECDCVRLTAMLVWGMDEVWRVRGIWVSLGISVCVGGEHDHYIKRHGDRLPSK